MPYSDPVPSRISQYHLKLTQYHQVPTILLYYADPVHSFIISKRTVEPTGSSIMLKFRQDFEAGVWLIFCRSCFEEVMKLNLGLGSEARFAADVWLKL